MWTTPGRSPRRAVVFASLASCFACGDVVSTTGRPTSAHAEQVTAPRIDRVSPSASASSSAAFGSAAEQVDALFSQTPTMVDEPTRSEPIGHLEQPHALRHLFEMLALLEDGHAHDDVRILQYGDSHTSSDFGTGAMRRALQARFGDGGRGFVSVGKPWTKYPYAQDGVRAGQTPEFHPEKGSRATRTSPPGDGRYGLLGIAVQSDGDAVGQAWTETTMHASRVELAYYEQPNGGSFDVFIDNSRVMRIGTSASKAQSAWRSFDVADAPHKVEVRSVGDGTVRLFGMTLDRATAGVELDSLGIGGEQIYGPLSWDEAHMAEQLRHRAPDLVVLAYGTNESMNDTPAAAYERKLVDLLGRMSRAVPGASCMLIGPPDRAAKQKDGTWESAPKVQEVVESQRRVAQAAGCAFFDQLAAMGGPGSIARWSQDKPPRGARDRVHLTRDGYGVLASELVTDMLHAYAAWRADTGLAPSGAPTTPTPIALQPIEVDASSPVAPHPHRRHRARP